MGSFALHPRDSPRHSAVYHLNPCMPWSVIWRSTSFTASGARGSTPPSGMILWGNRSRTRALLSAVTNPLW